MTEARPFPFTACVDHSNHTSEDIVTLVAPASCNFKPEIHARACRKYKNLSPATLCFYPEKYHSAFREIATVSATTCNNKSGKSLEERRAEIARIREKHPDRLPAILLQAEGSPMSYSEKSVLFPANSSLEDFFVMIWQTLYEVECPWKTYSLSSVVEWKDPIFEKPMLPVHEEYKDEDGCLYITLSGEKKELLLEPIPSCNIKTWTFYG